MATTTPAGIPFTYSSYRSLLENLQGAGYDFLSFREALASQSEATSPFVLMRHDIDFDLEKAVRMAEIEKDRGVRATYFFMLRTEHYNVLARRGTAAVRQILDLGHYLGLHFDCAAYAEDVEASHIAKSCGHEAQILEEWFGRQVEAVSFHRPSKYVLMGDPALSEPYPHTYMKEFVKQIHYCSDSRGEWKHGGPLDAESFTSRKPLHLLIHPVWWGEAESKPLETLYLLAAEKQVRMEESFADNCNVFFRRSASG